MTTTGTTDIATQLASLAKTYQQRGNVFYAKALRSQSRQAAKGVAGNWNNIIGNAINGIR